MTSPWIILDRDGVINQDSPNYIKSAEEWLPIKGSIEAIAALYKSGCRLVVATNQSGLGRKLFSVNDLRGMHRKMLHLVNQAGGRIEGVYYCPHVPEEQCNCRKPKTGLVQQICREHSVNPAQSVLLGDAIRDLQCALASGCQAALVRTGKGAASEREIHGSPHLYPTLVKVPVYDSLAAYARSRLNLK